MYRKFTPIIEAIQGDMEKQLAKPVDIHLHIFKTYNEGNDALVQGKVDFVRFGPASYIIAKSRNPEIQLLVMENIRGNKTFNGVITVRNDSKIKTLKDLKGKNFAFGDRNSTLGRYLAQAALVDAGIFASDLKSFDYLGRHDRVASSVGVGDYDAGSLKESTYENFRQRGELHTLRSIPNVTQPWIARAKLAPNVFEAIQEALLKLEDPTVLRELKVKGFFRTRDRDYDIVRTGMEKAQQFEGR